MQAAPTKDAADQNFDYMFKLLIIGNSSVGKTSFLFRYSDDSFSSSFVSTVGIDFKVKTVFQQDKRIKLQIWVRYIPRSCHGFSSLQDLLRTVKFLRTKDVLFSVRTPFVFYLSLFVYCSSHLAIINAGTRPDKNFRGG